VWLMVVLGLIESGSTDEKWVAIVGASGSDEFRVPAVLMRQSRPKPIKKFS